MVNYVGNATNAQVEIYHFLPQIQPLLFLSELQDFT